MKHNLFSSPSQINITFEDGQMKKENFIKSQSIIDIFEDLDYDPKEIIDKLIKKTDDKFLEEILTDYINDNSYLKTITMQGNK